ncbi:MAG: MBOAT family O-acyltransferase [Owenweeksia sp.]
MIVLIMLLSAVIDFSCGLIISKGRRKTGLWLSIFSNLAILGFFKYFNFTFDNLGYLLHTLGVEATWVRELPLIMLPIGVSFYTFQTMSYTIDVYRGKVQASRRFIEFATYVTMFPQLVAGPIVRYAEIQKQLVKKNLSWAGFSVGVERFIIGLAKKVLIANTFATIADDIFRQNTADLSSSYAWLGIIAYTFQIYFDFSGYSDMAIGLGRMLGFHFPENFNFPYISKSIREFWRRWHITLSAWFRDYLYISLGGNRKGSGRTYLNLVIVFFVTGLWHGASWNFVIWGLFHGLFMIIERGGTGKILVTLPKVIQHLYALLVVVVGWVFFRVEHISDAWLYLGKMFWPSSGSGSVVSYLDFFHLNWRTGFFLVVATIFSVPLLSRVKPHSFSEKRQAFRVFWMLLLFALSLLYIGADTYNPFIYFRF